jgi:subtilisin family serine protease
MKLKPETQLEKTLSVTLLVVVTVGVLLGGASFYYFSHQAGLIGDLQGKQVVLQTYATNVAPKKQEDTVKFVPNQLIIAFKPSASAAEKRSLLATVGATSSETLRPSSSGNALALGVETGEVSLATLKTAKPITDSRYLTPIAATQPAADANISLTDRVSLGQAIARVIKNPQVEYVQPNYIYSLADGPNDDLFLKGLEWNMYSTGQGLMSNQFGIQAPPVWGRGVVGSKQIYVAVIDTGIDATHPDLKGNVDTAHAVDLVRSSSQAGDGPYVNKDEIGHGTHVAGIIGAVGNNSIGIAGVTWAVQMIPVKVVKAGGNLNIDEATAIRAFEYVTKLKQSGINVVAVNASWGSYGIFDNDENLIPDNALLGAIKDAARQGVICIAAAGNNGNDNDAKPFYPANFDTTSSGDGTPGLPFDSVISVTALNPDGTLWPYSNFGKRSVQLGAPGAAIVSTIPANSQFARSGVQTFRSSDGSLYAVESGTSAAAPHVSGAIALYYANHPNATPAEVLDAISHAVTSTNSLAGRTSSGGRLTVSSF